ncbi:MULTISPECIES: type II secretion system protein GspM [Enterobacterales]|uniref:type II secretion system protein GspM n=1 Tax=Enterobacterales TaxID=91347 RepID=UPI002EDBA432
MKQWLMLKNERERRMILIAAFMLAVIVVWFGILTPLNNQIAKSRIQVNAQRNQLEWMVKQTQRPGVPSRQRTEKEKLTEVINASAIRLSLQFSKILADERGVTVSLEQISYSTLLRWLEVLNNDYGIQVVAITIVSGQVGSVSVQQLTLH